MSRLSLRMATTSHDASGIMFVIYVYLHEYILVRGCACAFACACACACVVVCVEWQHEAMMLQVLYI